MRLQVSFFVFFFSYLNRLKFFFAVTDNSAADITILDESLIKSKIEADDDLNQSFDKANEQIVEQSQKTPLAKKQKSRLSRNFIPGF